MSIRRILSALDADLPPADKLLLVLLADNADDATGKCWPSQAYLARRAGVTRKSVNQIISRLVSKGLVTVQKRYRDTGAQRSNMYRVLPSVTPPCVERLHPPVTQGYTEPVSNESITPITPNGSYPQVQNNARKLSAVEKAAAATARLEARIAADRDAEAGNQPALGTDDPAMGASSSKRVGAVRRR